MNFQMHSCGASRRNAPSYESCEPRLCLLALIRPEADPTDIGADDGWLKKFGRGGGKTAEGRYLKALELTL